MYERREKKKHKEQEQKEKNKNEQWKMENIIGQKRNKEKIADTGVVSTHFVNSTQIL